MSQLAKQRTGQRKVDKLTEVQLKKSVWRKGLEGERASCIPLDR